MTGRNVINVVRGLRKRRLFGVAAAFAAGGVALLAAAVLFAVLFSAWAGWAVALGLAGASAGAAGYVLWRLVGRDLRAEARSSRIIAEAESTSPLLRRRLGAAYSVAAAGGRDAGTSPALAAAFLDEVERRLPSRLSAPWGRRARWLPPTLLAAAVTAWLTVALAAPGFLGERFTALAEASPGPGGIIAEVSPGDAKVGVDQTLEVNVTLRQDFAGEAAVIVERGGAVARVPLESANERELRAAVAAGSEDFRYRVVVGAEKSRSFRVTVVPPPVFGALRVVVTPPAYAGLPARALPPGEGDVRALAGATVRIDVGAEGAEAVAAEVPGGTKEFTRAGDGFAGEFTLTRPDTYRLTASSPWGAAHTPYYALDVAPDAPPEVTIVEPTRDLLINDTSRSPRLRFTCSDDFGLGDVRVVYFNEVTGRRLEGRVGSGAGRAELEGDVDLLPEGLELFPGDVVAYYVEAFDNDTVNGPKAGRSATYRFRFPTTAELFEQVDDEMSSGVAELEGLREQTRRLREQLRKMDAVGDEENDTPSRPQIRELAEEQERLRRELTEAAEKLEELLECADDNVISPELAAKVYEANRLLEEALDEESKEALRKLSEALREVDPERVRELMEQVKLDQAEMERRLERVIDILKDARREELLRNLALQAEELAACQSDILERLEDADAPARQEDLAKDVPAFGEDVKESAAAFDEVDPALAEALRELGAEFEEGKAPRAARKASRELAEGDLSGAAEAGETSEQELEELAEALRGMSDKYREGKRQALLAEMDKAVERVLAASHRTERLAAEAALGEAGAGFAGRGKSVAAEVASIGDAAKEAASKSLFVSPAIGEALGDIGSEIEAGARNYELGNVRAAAEANARALAGLNVVAAMLLEARDNAASAGSSMGLAEMIEQMKAMAEGQRQLNREGKATMSMMPGMSPSELGAALERLAAEQERIRRGMEELERRGRGGERAGEMGGMARDMEELEGELRAGNLDERIIEKQEKLLERMLSSTRALRVQGRSSRRRAEPAREYAPAVVAPLPGRLTAPRPEAAPASGAPAEGYVPADLRGPLADYYRRMAGSE
jgi:hypothetical protein